MQTISKTTSFKKLRKTATVEFPEHDCAVILQELSIGQSKNAEELDLAQQLSLVIVDESGERIYTTEEDINNLREMGGSFLTRLSEAMRKLRGDTPEAVEATAKNSPASQTNDSASV